MDAIDQHILVNGEQVDIVHERALRELLTEFGIHADSTRGVAVAVNEEVIPKRKWSGVTLRPGDRVEIVTAKQGG